MNSGISKNFDAGMLGFLILCQGVPIAASALLLQSSIDLDNAAGISPSQWNSVTTQSSYPSSFIISCAGLSVLFALYLIIAKNSMSLIANTIALSFVMCFQFGVGALMAIATCRLINPWGPHSQFAPTIFGMLLLI